MPLTPGCCRGQNVIEHSDEISELNAEDYLEMPEVREEKIVPLTSDRGYRLQRI